VRRVRALPWILAPLWLGACQGAPAGRADLLLPATVDETALQQARHDDVDTVVLALHDGEATDAAAAAARAVQAAGLRLGYWLEIGRSPALADARPDLMASLQGHGEWRAAFPGLPEPAAGEVVKVRPWVPVAYRQAFDLHLARVARQLAALPQADLVYLNDLQGPPSACGCGNVLCRWATDYTLHGQAPRRTADSLGPDAAARFVQAVQRLVPRSRVVPVWVTECEEADTAVDGACHGVGCYHGACWREFDRQWQALRAAAPQVALLLPYRAFGRDLPRYGDDAGWVRFAIEHLRGRARERGEDLPGSDLIAVVQGWDDADDVASSVVRAREAGVTQVLVARTPVEQGFAPVLVAGPGGAAGGR
jgi:hypothetical protein